VGKRKFSDEVRDEAVKRVQAGEARKAVADDLGVSLPRVHQWMSHAAKASQGSQGGNERVAELRDRIARLELDVELLKKALASR
jgi:transposase-like protein